MDQRLNYATSLANDQHSGQSGSLSPTWQAPFASLGAGFTQGRDYRSTSVNASGSVLLHGGGIELGPHLGETVALVHVPDIPGVGLNNVTGVKTNA
ncbi:fimbria/pilus outer membrane usher protein, partial [Pandoraea sputorum]|uniref:fimbria/pilus outer membrane usher protein n=1 Tax=Pandoraea sputorum TaxID=93222 RepID=UPI0035564449